MRFASRLFTLLVGLGLAGSAWAIDSNTGETNEIRFLAATSADLAYPLASKASALNSPVEIYEYVRNNTDYALYHGARSGSINTFLSGRANDVDQAATLIAMLRAKGYPARYAVGTVRIPSAQVMNLLGVENADLAYSLLRDQGIQGVVLSADKSTIDMEHAWVEALVPYGNYRGAGPSSINCIATPASCNWVSLDPSFKQHQSRTSGLDPYSALSFDYTSYYNALKNNDVSRRDKDPLEIYENQILTWLQTNAPGKTLEDIPDFLNIISEQDGLLPASLPFVTVGTVRRYNSAADHDVAAPTTEPKKWTKYVTAQTNIGSITISGVSVTLVDASTQRLTFNFQSGVQAYYLGGVQVGTSITAGSIVINGVTVQLGTPFALVVTEDGAPAPDSTSVDQTITATYDAIVGGYYLIATGGETSNWSQVHRASRQLLDANIQYPIVFNPGDPGANGQACDFATHMNCTPYVDTTGNGWDAADPRLLDDKPALDALTGGLLYVAGTQYYAKFRDNLGRLDSLNKIKTPITGFLGVVSSTHEVEYIDGTAFSVLPGGLLIDMKGIQFAGSWRIDQAASYSNKQFELAGHIGSSLEHEVWQELTGYDAISTVRGIQMALAANASTTLVNPKRNASTDSLPSLYASFGYGTSAPSGFTKNVYSIFGQNYQAWSNPDTAASFYAFSPNTQGILNSNDPLLTLWTYSSGSNIDLNLSIYNNNYNFFVGEQIKAVTVATNVQLAGTSSNFSTADVISTYLSSSPGFKLSAVPYARVGAANSSSYNFFVDETSALADGSYGVTVNAVLSNKDGGKVFSGSTAPYAPVSVSAITAGFANNGFTYSGTGFSLNLARTTAADGIYTVNFTVLFTNGSGGYGTSTYTISGVQVLGGRIVLGTITFGPYTYTVQNNNNLTCGGTTYTNQTPTALLGYLQTCFNHFVALHSDYFSLFTPTASLEYRAIPAATDAQLTSKILGIRNDLNGRDINPAWVEYLIPSRLSVGSNYRFAVDIRKAYETATSNYISATYGIQNDSGIAAGGGYVTGSTVLKQATSVAISAPDVVSVVPTFNNATLTDQSTIAQVNNDLIKTPSSSDPISTVTGNNFHDETDFTIKGRNGLHYVFTRTYNSAPSATKTDLGLGNGWVHSYGMRLKSNDFGNCPNCPAAQAAENGNNKTSSITYTDERGGDHNYLVNESSFAITSPAGEFDTLAFDTPVAGQHTLTFRNGVKYIFETVGAGTLNTTPNLTARLKQIADPYGNQLNFTYNTAGRLATVTDNLGIAGRTGLAFAYDVSNHLQSITDWTTRHWNYSVDANTNLASYTNPLNQTLSYAYTAGTHNLITVAKPLRSAQTSFVYYQNGRTFSDANSLGETEALDYDLFRSTTRITDPRGGIREYEYDNAGRLLKLNEPDGAILQFSNNPDGLRNTKTDGLGYSTQYSYKSDKTLNTLSDTFGNVTRELDALSQSVDTSYGIYDQVASIKDKRGTVATTSFHTSTDGLCKLLGKPDSVSISNLTVGGIATANVKLKSACWNADGSAASVTDYLDSTATTYRRTSTTYDNTAHLNVQQLTLSGSDGLSVSRRFTYDNLGRKQTETLQRRISPTNAALFNLTTSYEYDALDRITAVIDVYGNRMETVYDANGQVYQQIARYKKADGSFDTRILSTRTYDAADRLLTDTDTLGGVTRYSYDAAGNVATLTDPEKHTSTYEYDAMNRRTAVIDGNGQRVTTDYDQAGHAIRLTNANGQATINTYDKLGRLTQTSDPLGNLTQMQYDANNNVSCVIDANAAAGLQPKNIDGCTVSTVYDELNRPAQSKDAQNRLTKTVYDLSGNVLSLTDPKNRVTTYSYDTLGRLTQITDPLGKTTSTLRDEAGNAYQVTNRLNEVTKITFDAISRAVRSDYQDGTAQTTTYSIYGNVIAQANNTLSYAFSYDTLNRLKTKTDSRGRSLAFNYDKSGRILSKSTYQNSTTAYTYDGTGKLAAITNPDYLNVNYQFDGAGQLLSRIMSSGAKSLYQYDANGQLMHLTHTNATGGTLTDIAYTRDKVGNILTQTDSSPGNPNAGTTTFTYDALSRLSSADAPGTVNDEAYTYDEVGNRLTATKGGIIIGAAGSTTRYYDILTNSNRLSQIHLNSATGTIELAFLYDNEGRLTSQTGITPRTLTWDAKGRLKTLTQSGTTETYAYDPTDHRIRRSGGTLGSLDYYLEGEHLESVEQNGSLQEKYFRGASIDELVAGYIVTSASNPELTPVLYQHDATMSVAAISEPNGGTVQTSSYSPFGGIQSQTGASTNRLGYTGRENDGTGVLYYRARYYDSVIGRFLSEDPLGFKAGINFYAYTNNNPVNANDPSGMRADVFATPLPNGQKGFSYTAIGPTGASYPTMEANYDIILRGMFNTTTDNRGNGPIRTGDYTLSPRPYIVEKIGVAGLLQQANALFNLNRSGDVNKHEGMPVLSNTDVPNLIQYSDGSIRTNITIHPGRDPVTGEGGNSLGCFVCNKSDFNNLNQMIQNNYDNGGSYFHLAPTPYVDSPSIYNNGAGAGTWGSIDSFGGAAGGYLLYPNKPNNNQMQSVYAK